MMETVRTWLLSITGAALISSVALALTPNGKIKKIVSLICGFAMITALISPIMSFDFNTFSQYIVEYKNISDGYLIDIEEENENLQRAIIEEESEAYILDKAAVLGIEDCSISVGTKKAEESYWYPYKAELGGKASESQKQALTAYIEANLGIPAERQYWSGGDEN